MVWLQSSVLGKCKSIMEADVAMRDCEESSVGID